MVGYDQIRGLGIHQSILFPCNNKGFHTRRTSKKENGSLMQGQIKFHKIYLKDVPIIYIQHMLKT